MAASRAEALDREGNVREVGDRAMAVLEVEGVEKLLGALGADLAERLLQRQGGARILRHRIGEDLGIGAVNGVDVGLGTGGTAAGAFAGEGLWGSVFWFSGMESNAQEYLIPVRLGFARMASFGDGFPMTSWMF